jgi:hypothetical protein
MKDIQRGIVGGNTSSTTTQQTGMKNNDLRNEIIFIFIL